MSGRRLIAVGVAALLLPTSALMTTQASSATQPAASNVTGAVSADDVLARKKKRKKKKKTRITINVLPQIAQYGKRPASPDAAKVAIEVQVKPKKVTKVTLQEKRGSKWKKAGKGKTDRKGKVVLQAKAKRKGAAVQYRVKAKGGTSKAQSTEKWLAPDFTDGFNGKKLGDHWTHRVQDYNPEGNRSCSRGSEKAVKVGKGTVRLSVMKDKSRSGKCKTKLRGKVTGKFNYRINGHISTETAYSFRYGTAAARIKFPKARGQHGSFWMQPDNGPAGAWHPKEAGAEIDIIEYFGKDSGKKGSMGLTSFTYHWAKQGKRVKTGNWLKNVKQYTAKKNDDWFKAYHVFSVEWTPKMYIFRIDGQETWRSKRGVSGQSQFPILSLLSSDYEIHQLGNERKLPQHMFVDWIRVWEQK